MKIIGTPYTLEKVNNTVIAVSSHSSHGHSLGKFNNFEEALFSLMEHKYQKQMDIGREIAASLEYINIADQAKAIRSKHEPHVLYAYHITDGNNISVSEAIIFARWCSWRIYLAST
ncbi:hypothetical protein D3C78_20400 [compost metagenome]